jgi:hypothetical protein
MNGNAPSPKRDRYQVAAALMADLTTASERYKQTAADFLNATDGVSRHDGLRLIHRTSDANRKALAEYQIALKRFSDFVINGIVPHDLKS